MALRLTQPLTEMSTRKFPEGQSAADALVLQPYRHLWADGLEMWDTRRLTNLWACIACYKDTFFYNYYNYYFSRLQMGIRRTDHATSLYPQKLALTSPTSVGRSVGIVHSRTKATELVRLKWLFNIDSI
jgi:hypothetical protein